MSPITLPARLLDSEAMPSITSPSRNPSKPTCSYITYIKNCQALPPSLRSYVSLGVLLLGLNTGCKPTVQPSPDVVSQVAILLDPSDSIVKTASNPSESTLSQDISKVVELRCSEAATRVQQILSWPDTDVLDVTVFATGDVSTGYEPSLVVDWTRFSFTEHTFGQQLSRKAQEHQFLTPLQQRCREKLKPTLESPIYRGFQRMDAALKAHADELRQRGEQVGATVLAGMTDLRESHNKLIKQRVNDITRALELGKELPAPTTPLPTLDLGDTKVKICGPAQHVREKGETAQSGQAVELLWHEIFGKNSPPFEPHCPHQSDLTAHPGPVEVQP